MIHRPQRDPVILLHLLHYLTTGDLLGQRHHPNSKCSLPGKLIEQCICEVLLTSVYHSNQWFTAIYAGLVGALYWCLLVNGFVGFQWAEDGTPMSLWVCLLSLNRNPLR